MTLPSSPASRRAILRVLLCMPPAIAATLLPTPGHAEGEPTQPAPAAAAPVTALNDGLLSVMRQGRATPFAERVDTLTPIVRQSFDLRQILQNSVGPRFASIPAARQAELLDAFTAFTVASYVANFDAFDGERFEVLPQTRRVGADTVVETQIVPRDGAPTRLDYVVRGQKVVDILFNGSISRVAVQRSDFRSLVATGDPSKLIAMLRNKTAGLAAGDKG